MEVFYDILRGRSLTFFVGHHVRSEDYERFRIRVWGTKEHSMGGGELIQLLLRAVWDEQNSGGGGNPLAVWGSGCRVAGQGQIRDKYFFDIVNSGNFKQDNFF